MGGLVEPGAAEAYDAVTKVAARRKFPKVPRLERCDCEEARCSTRSKRWCGNSSRAD